MRLDEKRLQGLIKLSGSGAPGLLPDRVAVFIADSALRLEELQGALTLPSPRWYRWNVDG